MQRWLLVPR
uniref:Uncharacterized protein n=1 Tax=Arundo donax TaxID=35708 RepID=A0A0A9DLL9_ARUDO